MSNLHAGKGPRITSLATDSNTAFAVQELILAARIRGKQVEIAYGSSKRPTVDLLDCKPCAFTLFRNGNSRRGRMAWIRHTLKYKDLDGHVKSIKYNKRDMV